MQNTTWKKFQEAHSWQKTNIQVNPFKQVFPKLTFKGELII